MDYTKKQIYVEKFNFSDGDNSVKKTIPGLKMPAKKDKLQKYVYQELRKIFKNYSENLPPLYLVDRRMGTDNSEYTVEKRDTKISDRRESLRRRNNFDRRHPQSSDKSLFLSEDDQRKEFSDRRDWIDSERRKIDKREIIISIKRISELIANYKAPLISKKKHRENYKPAKPDEILLLIKEQLVKGYPFRSDELIFDLLAELMVFLLTEKRFCGKLTDNSLGFYYYWINGKKQYFVKELTKKEFPAYLKVTPNYRTSKLHCCINFDPFSKNDKCQVGICTEYTHKTKKRLQRTELFKNLQDKLKMSR